MTPTQPGELAAGEKMRLRLLGCSSCDYDEAEGDLLDHCASCQKKIVALAYELFAQQRYTILAPAEPGLVEALNEGARLLSAQAVDYDNGRDKFFLQKEQKTKAERCRAQAAELRAHAARLAGGKT